MHAPCFGASIRKRQLRQLKPRLFFYQGIHAALLSEHSLTRRGAGVFAPKRRYWVLEHPIYCAIRPGEDETGQFTKFGVRFALSYWSQDLVNLIFVFTFRSFTGCKNNFIAFYFQNLEIARIRIGREPRRIRYFLHRIQLNLSCSETATALL